MVTDLLIPADLRKLTPTQAAYEDDLLALPNVVGVALGHKLTESGDTGTPCVQVLVDMKVSPDLLQPDEIVPMKIGATPTDVIEVGLVEACSGSELTPSRARDWAERYCEKRVHLPDVTDLRAVSPTLPRAQQVAAANSATRARAAIGGIGTSERNPTPQVGDILGMSGRAGDHTAPILGLNATIAISYSSGRIVRFAKQIITSGALSPGEDSGAVVTDLACRVIGLLFATSPQVAVLSPMPLVEHLLDARSTDLNGAEQNGTGRRATRQRPAGAAPVRDGCDPRWG